MGDLVWGGEHTMQYTHDVLWTRAPEACIILLTSVTSIQSVKRKEEKAAFCVIQ